MNPNDTYDAGQDPDRTVLIPTPGGRRPPPQAAAPEPPTRHAAASPSPPPSPPPSLETLQLRAAQAAAARAALPAPAVGSGLNPLVRAANPLLDLALPLRTLSAAPDLAALRDKLSEGVRRFEAEARAAQADTESIAAARYALCTLIDETISSTPWGGGVWNRRSLLVAFHNEAWGGEKFFLILQRLSADPRRNLDLLELMYLCLALGLEGRYRVMERGHEQLALLRERLLAMITQQRGPYEQDLSPHWRGEQQAQARPLMWPSWVMGVCAGVILLLLQMTYSWLLNRQSDRVYADLGSVRAAPPARAPAPAPAAPGPARLGGFLAAEVAAGLVTVTETAERSVVTLRGDGGFASGSDEVEARLLPTLRRIGDALRTAQGRVVVVGHTDDTRPRLSARLPSNFDLSKARARNVAALLAERAGPPERYASEGRGETEPLAPNDGPANRARNRRVDIILLTPPQPR